MSPTEHRLLRLVRGNEHTGGSAEDRRAVRAILEEIQYVVGWVIGSSMKRCGVSRVDGMDKQDATQEIVARLLADNCQALANFDRTLGTLKRYVAKAARWGWTDMWRKHQRRAPFHSTDAVGDPPSLDYSPEEIARGREAAAGIRAYALERLTSTERIAFVRHYEDSLSIAELRVAMSWSPGQVHTFRYRVKRLAHEFLERE